MTHLHLQHLPLLVVLRGPVSAPRLISHSPLLVLPLAPLSRRVPAAVRVRVGVGLGAHLLLDAQPDYLRC